MRPTSIGKRTPIVTEPNQTQKLLRKPESRPLNFLSLPELKEKGVTFKVKMIRPSTPPLASEARGAVVPQCPLMALNRH